MVYQGSKNRISKYIVPIIQSCINDNNVTTYIEPFVGGANLIDKIHCENRYGYDTNKYLIAFWNEVQNGWDISKEYISKEQYYDIKIYKEEKYPLHIVALAGTCFSYCGSWFHGYSGVNHTLDGRTRKYYEEKINNVIKQIPNIQSVVFKNIDFFEYSNDNSNSVIYCDAPYENTEQYINSDFNYKAYWDKIRQLSENNYVFVSEYNAPDDFVSIWSKTVTNTINYGSKKSIKSGKNNVENLYILKDSIVYDYMNI